MKFRVGTKVRVVRLLDKFTNPKYLGKVSGLGYFVLLDDWPDEATFMEAELEAV